MWGVKRRECLWAAVVTTAMGVQGGGYARADEPNPTSVGETTPRSDCYVEYWNGNEPDMKTRVFSTQSGAKSSSREDALGGKSLEREHCCICDACSLHPLDLGGLEPRVPNTPWRESRGPMSLEVGRLAVLNFNPALNMKPIRGPARIEQGLSLEALDTATLQCEDEGAPR